MTDKRSLGDEALDALDAITKGDKVRYDRTLPCLFVAPRDGVVVGFHMRSDRAWPLVYEDEEREVVGAVFYRFGVDTKVRKGNKLRVNLNFGITSKEEW